MNARIAPLRVAAVSALTVAVCAMAAPPAVAAGGDVEVVNTETVQVYTSPTGEIETQRVYEQLALTGTGSVDLSNPVSTDGLRNLDGFSGFEVRDGNQIAEVTVDGEKRLRSVSEFDGELPLDVSVKYQLDGKTVEPGDVVGEGGKLDVTYTVTNVTAQPQEVSFPDGNGGTSTETVDVPIPMVGSLTTTAPSNFTNVSSQQANMAGDGKGGTKLSFTMTLFPPIGSDTTTFGYTADIVDGVVPRADISALPVNPLESPTFASAAESYQGGADTGARLAEGAGTIDENLLKLRDGASDLLAGLIQLRDGSSKLQAGLAGEAAPGAAELADGLSRIDDGAGQLSDGAGRARTGSQQLTDGLQQISGGLGQLADAQSGLPKASNGVTQLQDGVDRILAGFGDVDDPTTLIGGLHSLETGLAGGAEKAPTLAAGLRQLRGTDAPGDAAGLVDAKGGVDLVKAGLDSALAPANGANVPGGTVAELILGLNALKGLCATHPAAESCSGLVAQMLAGAEQSKNSLGAASAGLGSVSAGIGRAVFGLDALIIPGAQALADGFAEARDGATKLKAGAIQLRDGVTLVDGGLGQLSEGLTNAVDGVFALSDGSVRAAAGSLELTDGLGRLDDGAGELAAGTGKATDGAGRLADGLQDAADGSGRLTDGLGQAADGAPRLVDGAGRLSDEGTSKLVDAGEETAQNYGQMVAVMEAGAERAQTEKMAYGAPEGAAGLTAYSYVIQGEDGEAGRNWIRGLAGLALLGLGGGAFALRRRLV